MKERNRRNVPPVLRTGGTILSKKPEEKHVIANQRRNAGVAPSGDSLRSQSVLPPWLPLWGSCHEVTERVQIALSALTGHLSHRERQVSLIRHGKAVPPSPRGRLEKNESGVLFYSFSFSANLRVTSAHRWAASRSKVG